MADLCRWPQGSRLPEDGHGCDGWIGTEVSACVFGKRQAGAFYLATERAVPELVDQFD